MRGYSPLKPHESAWIGLRTAKLRDFRRDERAWSRAFDDFADEYPGAGDAVDLAKFRAHANYLRRKQQAKLKASRGKKSNCSTKTNAKRSQRLVKAETKSCLEFASAASTSTEEMRDWMTKTTKQLDAAVGRLAGAVKWAETIKDNKLEIQSLKSRTLVNEEANEDRFRRLEERVAELSRQRPKKRLVRSHLSSFRSFDAFADEECDE